MSRTREIREIYFLWKLPRNLYNGHLVIADTFFMDRELPQ